MQILVIICVAIEFAAIHIQIIKFTVIPAPIIFYTICGVVRTATKRAFVNIHI